MALRYVLLLTFVVAVHFDGTNGHGMVIDPPGRGSAWRYGFGTPKNPDDMSNTCGHKHQTVNTERCGICGDAFDSKKPRDHETGGKYGTGTIVKTYKMGETITVIVNLTAAHKGSFTFSICPLKTHEVETEKCFKKLQLASGGEKFTDVTITKLYKIKVSLPKNLRCDHCILRWQYRAGNNWNECNDGTGAHDCGLQETFRTCSDIKIV